MLDIQFIRDNAETVETKAKQKGYDVNIQELLQADQDRRAALAEVEELRRKRNEHSDRIKQAGFVVNMQKHIAAMHQIEAGWALVV